MTGSKPTHLSWAFSHAVQAGRFWSQRFLRSRHRLQAETLRKEEEEEKEEGLVVMVVVVVVGVGVGVDELEGVFVGGGGERSDGDTEGDSRVRLALDGGDGFIRGNCIVFFRDSIYI